MEEVCIISGIKFKRVDEDVPSDFITNMNFESENINVWVYRTNHKKCLRCWQYREDVTEDSELCKRCIQAIS